MYPENEKCWADEVVQKCVKKYRRVAAKNKNGIPYTTDADGNYDNRADASKKWGGGDGLSWWTNGFWGGIMWQMYDITKDKAFSETAAISEKLLDRCFEDYYGLHHDVGFMWMPTAVANYRLTGNAESRKRALHAANLLAGRFNLAGRFIRAWNDWPNNKTVGWAIIDCMMNLTLLYWASNETNDPRFSHIAKAHADTAIANFIREDGSARHIVEFDAETGAYVRDYGGQGYAEGTSWTRGQAWALYGFALSHKYTGSEAYLQTAKRVADYFIAHIPASGLIPIDFNQPEEPKLEDSCGAAIAASGLLELAAFCDNEGQKYRDAALTILHALDNERSDYGTGCDAVLTHCSGAYHSKDSHHIRMVYADFFYIDALLKINGGLSIF